MATETAEPPVETKPPVTAPGETSLAQAFKETLKKQQAAIAQPDPEKVADKATEKPGEKVDKPADEKPPDKAADKKPASPLDAALEASVEKPAETKPADEIPLNAPAKTLRDAYERQKAEAIKWKGEAEKAKSDPATKQQLESLKAEREKLAKENAELRDAITAVNVEYDPEVRAKFHDGKNSLIEKTTKEVEQFGGDSKAFAEAMQLPRGKARTLALKGALENVDEMDRPAIHNKLAKIAELEEEHADLLKNSQKSYEELTEKQRAKSLQQQEQIEKAKAEMFDRVSKSISSKNPTLRFVGEEIEGHEGWNADLKEAHQRALQKLGPDADLESIMETAIRGERLDFVEGLLLDERKTTQQLREELKQYQSAEPGFEGRNKTSVVSKLDKTPAQIYKEEMAKLSGRSED